MNITEPPVQSIGSLIKAAFIAVVFAMVILITVVLPAEYGIDPTGLGEKMGLTVLAAPVVETAITPIVSCDEKPTIQKGSIEIVVPANSGLEYKLHIEKDVELTYSWRTSGAALYFDFHGEPQGDKTGYFKSFKEATLSTDAGVQKIPFTGSHGWYWKNETDSAITVFLETEGEYQVIGLR